MWFVSLVLLGAAIVLLISGFQERKRFQEHERHRR